MFLYVRPASLITLVFLLVACGFHLRGVIELPPQLSPLYLSTQQADHALSRELEILLQTNNVVLAINGKDAAAVLTIQQSTKNRRVLSVDSLGRAREYELDYLVKYNLKIPGADSTEKTIHLKRDLLFDPTSVLAVGHETETLYKDMASQSARLILQKLQAVGKKIERKVDKKKSSGETQ